MQKTNKFTKLLKAIVAIVKTPSLLNLVLDDANEWQKSCQKKYKTLAHLPILPWETLIPQGLNIKTCFLDGGSMPTDIALLKALALRLGSQASYFEIGTWRGESVYNVAEVLEDCSTLNLSAAEMQTLGWSPKYAELHGILSKKKANIKHLLGHSQSFDFAALNKKYDLIFIDGDHSYAMVKHDTEEVFKHLKHENTIIVWHDYAFNPEKIRYEVLQGILDAIPSDKHQHLYHVENSMCAVYLPQKQACKAFESPCKPEHWFNVSISQEKI